jgi:hypothetical protein
MKRIRTWFSVFVTFALVLVAGGVGAAPEKQFGLTVNQAAVNAGTTVDVTVKFENRTPNGNSLINSIRLTVPAGVSNYVVQSVTTVNGNVTTTGGTASPSTGGGGQVIAINGMAGAKPLGNIQVKLSVTVPTTATCSVASWAGVAFTGNSWNGDPFVPYPNVDSNVAAAYVGCDGILACGDATIVKPVGATPDTPGYGATTRSFFNKDGTTNGNGCVPVPYSFTNALVPSNSLHTKWLVQDTAVFTTTANSALRPLDPITPPATTPTTGWTSASRPRVAWVESSPGVPDPVPGLACLGTNPPTNLPGPYGTLSAPISDSATTITIVPVAGGVPLPTSGTFPLTIGRERMQATFSSTNTYTVARGQGGTTPAGYTAGAPVMSTPLPIIPNVAPFNTFASSSPYATGKHALMCVLEFGVQSGGIDPATGDALVFDFTTVIDIGDGWVFPH